MGDHLCSAAGKAGESSFRGIYVSLPAAVPQPSRDGAQGAPAGQSWHISLLTPEFKFHESRDFANSVPCDTPSA